MDVIEPCRHAQRFLPPGSQPLHPKTDHVLFSISIDIPIRFSARKLAQEGNQFVRKRNRTNFFIAGRLTAAPCPAAYLFASANWAGFPLTASVVSRRIAASRLQRAFKRVTIGLGWLLALKSPYFVLDWLIWLGHAKFRAFPQHFWSDAKKADRMLDQRADRTLWPIRRGSARRCLARGPN